MSLPKSIRSLLVAFPAAKAKFLLAVIALTFGSKLAAFGRDVALSSTYGAGVDTDAFFIANAIPMVVWSAFWTTIGMVFMPLYTIERHRSVRASSIFANNAIVLYGCLAILLTALCFVFARQMVMHTTSGSSEPVVSLATQLTMIMSLGFIFSGYVTIQNSIQQSRGQVLPPLIVPLLNNLLVILGVLLSYFWGGIYLVVVFSVLGWVAQAPIQRMMTRTFYRPERVKPWRDKTTQRLFVLSIPVFFGVFLDQINSYIGIYLSAGFGEGAISHLSYANRLSGFMAGLFSFLVAYLVFPKLAEAAARDRQSDVSAVLARGLGLILATTAPMVILSLCLSHEIIGLVFGRGAFGSDDINAAALIFQFYAYGILFVAAREIFNRVLFSYHKTSIPLYVGVLSAAVNIASSIVLSRHIGAAGIAAGAAVSAIFYVLLQIAYLLRWKRDLLNNEALRWTLVVLFASLAMAAAIGLIIPYLDASTALIKVAATSFASMPAYALGLLVATKLFPARQSEQRALEAGTDE